MKLSQTLLSLLAFTGVLLTQTLAAKPLVIDPPIIIDPPAIKTWAGYPWYNDAGDVNTGDFLGWVNVQGAPWIWSYALSSYLFVDSVDAGGGWVYFSRPGDAPPVMIKKSIKLPGDIIIPIQLYWSGYPWANANGDVSTGAFIGWINVKNAPWVWCYAFNGYSYLPTPANDAAGAWAYRMRTVDEGVIYY